MIPAEQARTLRERLETAELLRKLAYWQREPIDGRVTASAERRAAAMEAGAAAIEASVPNGEGDGKIDLPISEDSYSAPAEGIAPLADSDQRVPAAPRSGPAADYHPSVPNGGDSGESLTAPAEGVRTVSADEAPVIDTPTCSHVFTAGGEQPCCCGVFPNAGEAAFGERPVSVFIEPAAEGVAPIQQKKEQKNNHQMKPLGLHNPSNRELPKEWRVTLMQDPCVYCGAASEGLDHIRASSRKGSDGWVNRAPACRTCDELKGPASLLTFLLACQWAQRHVARRRRYRCEQARIAAWRFMVSQTCKAEGKDVVTGYPMKGAGRGVGRKVTERQLHDI